MKREEDNTLEVISMRAKWKKKRMRRQKKKREKRRARYK